MKLTLCVCACVRECVRVCFTGWLVMKLTDCVCFTGWLVMKLCFTG